MKKIKNVFLGLLIISLSSCLKADDMNIDAKYKTNVIELANTGDNITNAGIPGFYSDLGVVAAGQVKQLISMYTIQDQVQHLRTLQ